MIDRLQARSSRLRKDEGFTLIELLIVLVILGILATIVLFATGTFSDDAKTSSCKANVRIMQTAEAAYSAANDGDTSNHSEAALGKYLEDGAIPDNVTYNGTADKWECA